MPKIEKSEKLMQYGTDMLRTQIRVLGNEIAYVQEFVDRHFTGYDRHPDILPVAIKVLEEWTRVALEEHGNMLCELRRREQVERALADIQKNGIVKGG